MIHDSQYYRQNILETIALMREFIQDGSVFRWKGEGLDYYVFKRPEGWLFEWDRDGIKKTLPDSDKYFAHAFWNGGTLNGLTFEEWLKVIECHLDYSRVDVETLI